MKALWKASLVALAFSLCALRVVAAPDAEPQTRAECRFGVSHASFGTVNRNDASAALRTWAAMVSKERQLSVNLLVEMFDEENQLRQALESKRVDAVSMTAEEFLHSGQKPDSVLVIAREDGIAEQFVLVVHQNGGLNDLPALKGRKLVRHVSPRTSPALPWLETALASRGLEQSADLFHEVATMDSPSKAVLRVFFRQSDACLVSSNAFKLACELNPQLRKDLKVLATSPPLIAGFFFFRSDCTKSIATEVEAAILDLHSTPAGQQVLTVMQGSRMVKQPSTCVDATVRILKEYEQLKQRPRHAGSKAAAPAANSLTP